MKNAMARLLCCTAFLCAACAAGAEPLVTWGTLPALPDSFGFGAPFVGCSNGVLLVAGGANFPEQPPWAGGKKAWYDTVFALESPEGAWKKAGHLPRSLAYGVSITTKRGLACIGGADATRHYTDSFLLIWRDGAVVSEPLPSLPKPVAYACGALAGNTIYIAGGREGPDTPATLHSFYALDLGAPNPAWRELEPWPGAPRMLAVAGALDGSFFLFGGTDLIPDAPAKPRRQYSRDAYRYTPGQGWKRLADLPVFSAAAPTPAAPVGTTQLLVFGGDDGANVDKDLREAHPGFASGVLAYDVKRDAWTKAGTLPKDAAQGLYPPVTTSMAEWNGGLVLPSGEIKPGIRTPKVLVGRIAK